MLGRRHRAVAGIAAPTLGRVPPDEELDVVEPDGTPVGRRSRREVHERGLWHQVFHCLVVRTGTPARVVLQQRHHGVRSFPGKLDLSATGHLAAGESPLEGLRELTEELGVEVDPDRLVPLGTRLLVDDGGEGRNRERVHVYLLSDDRPLDAFHPDPHDVAALVEVTTDDLLAILADPAASVPARRWVPGAPPEPVAVAGVDLVPAVDGYWTVLAVMADRHVRGQRPVAI
jgi:isopentenyldiphosphate isomerase